MMPAPYFINWSETNEGPVPKALAHVDVLDQWLTMSFCFTMPVRVCPEMT